MKLRFALFATSCLFASQVVLAQQGPQSPVELKPQAAQTLAHATDEMLLAVARAGSAANARLVAVGDHGVILLSDDGGKTFRQAKAVPIRAALTSVSFADEKHGWAAGHWGSILATSDGGETWTLQRHDTTTDRPLFGIHFTDADHGVAVGLWSLLLTTQDAGKTWNEVKLQAPPDGGKADRNLLGIFSRGKTVYVAAERGMVLRSEDLTNWTYLNTGYKGSFWTGLALKDGTLIVAGLRGSLYRSTDDGKQWKAMDSGTKSSLTGLAETKDGLLAVGLDGVVQQSSDGGLSFKGSQREDRLPLTAVIANDEGKPLALSKHGVVGDLLPQTAKK